MKISQKILMAGLFILFSSLAIADDYDEIVEPIDDGWWDDARAIAEKQLSLSPDDPRLNFLMGKCSFLLEDYDDAEDYLKKAVKLDDSVSEYHHWLGNVKGVKAQTGGILKAPGRAKACKKEYERAIELNPENIEARFALMQYLMQAPGFLGGDKDKAFVQADIMAGMDSTRGDWSYAILYEYAEDDYEKAEARLKAAIDRDSTNLDPYFWYGQFLARRERYDEAESLCFAAMEIDSTNTQVYHSLGRVYEQMERYDDAIAQHEKALAIDTTNMLAVYQIGKMLILAEKDLDRAEGCFKKYLNARLKGYWPGKSAAHWRLAMAYNLQAKYELARGELERGLALGAKHTEEEMKELLREVKKKLHR